MSDWDLILIAMRAPSVPLMIAYLALAIGLAAVAYGAVVAWLGAA